MPYNGSFRKPSILSFMIQKNYMELGEPSRDYIFSFTVSEKTQIYFLEPPVGPKPIYSSIFSQSLPSSSFRSPRRTFQIARRTIALLMSNFVAIEDPFGLLIYGSLSKLGHWILNCLKLVASETNFSLTLGSKKILWPSRNSFPSVFIMTCPEEASGSLQCLI